MGTDKDPRFGNDSDGRYGYSGWSEKYKAEHEGERQTKSEPRYDSGRDAGPSNGRYRTSGWKNALYALITGIDGVIGRWFDRVSHSVGSVFVMLAIAYILSLILNFKFLGIVTRIITIPVSYIVLYIYTKLWGAISRVRRERGREVAITGVMLIVNTIIGGLPLGIFTKLICFLIADVFYVALDWPSILQTAGGDVGLAIDRYLPHHFLTIFVWSLFVGLVALLFYGVVAGILAVIGMPWLKSMFFLM